MEIKKLAQWLVLTILGYALVIALLLIANAFVFNLVTSNPDRIKAILENSGVYKKIPSFAFDNLQTQQTENSALANPEVKSAAKEVFNDEFFKKTVESGVDDAYAWLNGESDKINFSIDLNQQKEDFISKVIDFRLASIEGLPVCTTAQLSGQVDIFTLDCKPPYALDKEGLKQQVREELAKGDNFIARGNLGAEELKNEEGKAFYESMPNLPANFQAAKKLPYFLLFFAALLSVAIIFISESRKRGLLSLSRFFIVSGIFTLFAPGFIGFLSNQLLSANKANQPAKDIVLPLLNEFNSSTAYIYHWAGGILILLGIVGLLAYSGKLKMPKGLSK